MPFKVIPERRICGITINRRRKICLFVCCGIILLAIAIGIPLVIFVIGPKIAQGALNTANLSLNSASITGATNTSFILASSGSVTNAGFLDATVKFDGPVNVYWTGRPDGQDIALGNLNLPDISVGGSIPKSASISFDNTVFTISDPAAMGTFSQSLVSSDTFTWKLSGAVKAVAFGLTFSGLSFSKDVVLTAFGGLKNVSITSFDLPSSDPTTGIVLKTTTLLGNPSTISIDLGQLFFDAFFDGKQIGSLSTNASTSLKPGANYLNLNGALLPIDSKDTTTLSKLFTLFVGGQSSPLSVVSTNVIGQNGPVSWLQKGLIGTTLNVTLNAPQSQKLVSNLQIPSLSVAFNPSDATGGTIATDAQVNAKFTSPFAFPLSIVQASQNLNFVDPTTNTAFASLVVPFTAATSDQAAQKLSTSFTGASLTVIPGQETLFSNFFKSLTLGSSYSAGIKGSVSAIANTAAGQVTISNVSLVDSVSLSGFQGLNQVSISSVTVASGSASGIGLQIATVINNPSTISLNINADVTLSLLFNGKQLGTVVLPKLSLKPGSNTIQAQSTFAPQGADAVAAGRTLLSNFVAGTGANQGVTIVGSTSSVPYKLLQPTFDGLTISANLPGLTSPLISKTTIAVSIATLTTAFGTGKANLFLNNPFQVPFAVTHLTATFTYQGAALGTVDQDFAASPLSVPASSTAFQVGPVTAQLTLGIAAIKLVLSAISNGGAAQIDITSTITASVGGYATTLDYNQNGVTTMFSN
ncbi:hypothetical protein DFJ73DRAFT_632480 [Zopfochytrium polystomum]|nr:hypothetical protein DFJ73DRAFT_632480 [Zopfochytrium polystomum]